MWSPLQNALLMEEKKQDDLRGTEKFAMASRLTERKLDEASGPLIIPGNVFAHSLQENRFREVVVCG